MPKYVLLGKSWLHPESVFCVLFCEYKSLSTIFVKSPSESHQKTLRLVFLEFDQINEYNNLYYKDKSFSFTSLEMSCFREKLKEKQLFESRKYVCTCRWRKRLKAVDVPLLNVSTQIGATKIKNELEYFNTTVFDCDWEPAEPPSRNLPIYNHIAVTFGQTKHFKNIFVFGRLSKSLNRSRA